MSATTQPVSWKEARESGTALYAWRRSIGVNRPTFARLVDFSERTMADVEKQKRLPAAMRARVTEAVRLLKGLLDIIPAEQLTDWLQSPNPGFRNRKPWDLIISGERDLVWEMIHQTRQGTFA